MSEEEVVTHPDTTLLIETLDTRCQTYRNELKRSHKEPSEEAIHDLRVATRRLLALIEILQAISPHPRLKKLRRELKEQLDSLDSLRDVQVMLVDINKRLEELPELIPFQSYLIKREKRLLRSTSKQIKSFKAANIRKRIDSTRKSLRKLEKKDNQPQMLLQVVDGAFQKTLQRLQRVEPTQPASIHRVRIAFKKFRYMVEVVHPLVPNFPEENFKPMHDYQSMMGNIQDLEVFSSTFEKFADRHDSYDPQPVCRFYQQRHNEAINVFIDNMEQVHLFWRPMPEALFPWEAKSSRKKSTQSNKPAEPLPAQEKDEKQEQVEAEKEANS